MMTEGLPQPAEIDSLKAENARLREALTRASGRLSSCALGSEAGSERETIIRGWAHEARAALEVTSDKA